MPPKSKFTREEILSAAVELTREKGIPAVTARAVAERLGASSKVIFGLFHNMEELQQAVISHAHTIYLRYILEDTACGSQYPPYKASGMGYIRFANEEKELFKLLFMRNRTGESIDGSSEEMEPIIRMIQQNTGLSAQQAYLFHLEMWIFVHGIATMLATNYLPWGMETISDMLTDMYEGLKKRFIGGHEDDSNPNH